MTNMKILFPPIWKQQQQQQQGAYQPTQEVKEDSRKLVKKDKFKIQYPYLIKKYNKCQ